MPESIIIERPSGLQIPERRALTARFIDPPEIRDGETGDGSYTFIGHAAVWNRLSVDLGGFRERITRGAFTAVLDDPLLDVTLVADHGMGALTTVASTRGKTLELSEDAKGLRVYASVAPTTVGSDLKILMQRGDVQGMSFGFSIDEGGDTWAIEGDETVRTVLKVSRLYDVSIVSFPAYPATDVSVRGLALLVERRERLDLFDSTTGAVRRDEVARIRTRVDRLELELSPDQRAALDRASELANEEEPMPPAPDPRTDRSIESDADLRMAIRALIREPDQDAARAAVTVRAAELGAPGLIPASWAPDGSLRADALTTAELRETYNDLYTGLAAALDDALVTNGDYWWCWVQDFTDDTVIFVAGGDLYSAPYTVTPNGPISIDVDGRVKVRPVTEYVETEPTPAAVGDPEDSPAARDMLGHRLRLQAMELQL